jgi:MFS superfamily sulfate permease-like transporter
VPAWPFAVASLPVAFAVAQATGVRPLGGIVLVVLAAMAVLAGRRDRVRSAAWVAVLLVCFVASHLLADPLGTWGAVALVTAVTGAAGFLLLDRQAPRAAAVHQG